jgi:curved DNA-binding protein CbpA
VAESADYYRILQVDPSAEDAVIQAAYRALMKRYHPDRVGPDRSARTTVAQQLNSAYATLSNPKARELYDRLRRAERAAVPPGAPRAEAPRPPRALAGDIAGELSRTFEPLEPGGVAALFDFAGRLRGSPRDRVWIKQLTRGTAADIPGFRMRIEAARLARSMWQPGSDLFVAAVPSASESLDAMLRAPGRVFPNLSWAVVALDLGSLEVRAASRADHLRTVAALRTALPGR